MVKHIVTFRLDGTSEQKALMAADFKAAIEALPTIIPELTEVEVGINDGPAPGNADIVLTAVCPDYEALETYSAHPAHLECVAIIKPAIALRACVDYTV